METIRENVKREIADYIQKYDYPPSIREIADLANCALSTAHKYVTELLLSGELESDHPGASRAIRMSKRNYRIDSKKLMAVIVELSGCDGVDDYANGWDDACETILRKMEDMMI